MAQSVVATMPRRTGIIRNCFQHPLTRCALVTGLVGIFLVSLPPLANLSYDVSYLARPRVQITNLVVVAANEETVALYGDGARNIHRTNHANMVHRLVDDQARLIFYDFAFNDTNADPAVDRVLEHAFQKADLTILGTSAKEERVGPAIITEATPILGSLTNVASGWGHLELFEGVNRRVYGNVGNVTNAVWVAASKILPELQNEHPNQTRWLNYYGDPGGSSIPEYSFQMVLSTNLPEGFFRNKFVFVGQGMITGQVLEKAADSKSTPFTTLRRGKAPGVKIHATSFLNLVRGSDWLEAVPLVGQILLAFGWALTTCAVFRGISRRPLVVMLFVGVLLAVGLSGVSLFLQWKTLWWWSWIGPAFAETAVALVLVRRQPKVDPYLAFISYRNDSDGAEALLLQRALGDRNIKTFLDVRSLQSGRFDEQLLQELENSTFFVILLSPGSLERCGNPDDWVLRELRHALLKKKTIIPVFNKGFTFDSPDIPDLSELKALSLQQGVAFSNKDFDGFIDKLLGLLNPN